MSSAEHENPSMEPARMNICTHVLSLTKLVDTSLQSQCQSIIQALQEVFGRFGKTFVKNLVVNVDEELNDTMLKLVIYNKTNIDLICQYWDEFFKLIITLEHKNQLKPLIDNAYTLIKDSLRLPIEVFIDLNYIKDKDEAFKDIMDKRNSYGRIISSIGLCLGLTNFSTSITNDLTLCMRRVLGDLNDINTLIDLEALLTSIYYLLKCILSITISY